MIDGYNEAKSSDAVGYSLYNPLIGENTNAPGYLPSDCVYGIF